MFADLFAKVDTGVDITDYDVAGGVLPADPGEQDGWLISGARASVVDDEPWITDLLGVVRELDRTGSPTVGVCFGHQLLALALGGEVLGVGGLDHKLLAAHRHGIRRMIIPKANEPDLDDLPDTLANEMSIITVDDVEQALRVALQ